MFVKNTTTLVITKKEKLNKNEIEIPSYEIGVILKSDNKKTFSIITKNSLEELDTSLGTIILESDLKNFMEHYTKSLVPEKIQSGSFSLSRNAESPTYIYKSPNLR